MEKLFKWVGLYGPDGRRAWAFLALLLGCGIMTGFAAVSLYLVSNEARYVFWLGIAAHVQIGLALTGFMAMFVKRDLGVETKVGSLHIKDSEGNTVDAEAVSTKGAANADAVSN